MRRIRAIRKFLLYVSFLSFVYVLIRLSTLFFPPSSRKRIRWRTCCFQIWSRGSARILGIKMHLEGCPPSPPFLLVCNHLSYIDIMILASCLRGRFVAKGEVAYWPWVGSMVRSMDTIFIDRENKRDILRVNRLIQDAWNKGDGVILFAEGTSSKGEEVLPLKSSLFECAAQNHYPVHWASISYRTPKQECTADRSVCWWGDMKLLGHFMHLLEMPKIYATLTFGPQPLRDHNRKILAKHLRASIQQQFVPCFHADHEEEP